jgi:tetratricopeptide (TPR) repeat protein
VRIRRSLRRISERLADLGAAIVWPFEAALRATFGRLLEATENIDSIEVVLTGIVRLVTWPFRLLFRTVRGAAGWLPEPVAAAIAWPLRRVRWLQGWLLHNIVVIAEALNLDRVVLALVWVTQPVWRPIAAVLGFAHAWLVTRDWRQMLWGLPALVMLLPFVLVLGRVALSGNDRVASQYKVAVKQALEEKDYDRVRLYERKLAQLGVDTQRTDFRTAKALADKGELDQALERMRELAPEDRPGYAEAHYWIVQQLLQGKLDVAQDDMIRQLGVHLDHLETLGVQGAQLALLRSIQLAGEDRVGEAIEILAPWAATDPRAAVERMRMHLALNDREAARDDARHVSAHMEAAARDRGQLTADDYRWWAVALDLQGNLIRLRSVVEDWRQVAPDDEDARQATATVSRVQLAELIRARRPDPKALSELVLQLAEASDLPGEELQIGRALWQRYDEDQQLREGVALLLKSPRLTAKLSESIGTAAALANNLPQALLFMRRATELDAELATAWNNSGWILAHLAEPDYQEALQRVNRALELKPNEYRFRETRGQIYVALGRWQEAVTDLEYAANGLPELRDIHQGLAKAYAALGNDELAQVHAQYVE